MKTYLDLLSDPVHGLVREVRQPQLAMAASVEDVLVNGGVYFGEGPVGLGKSLAYLVPALLASGRRIVVATAKKGLQDQLVNKDIPAIKQAIGSDIRTLLGAQTLVTPLKGKGNYTCPVLAESAIAKGGEGGAQYEAFIRYSNYGDRADYQGPPPRWWAQASAEDCVGKRCEQFENCGFIRLKRDATQSKVVVINHHVLGAEMFFGLGKLVGGPYDVLIVDEAHTLAAGIRAAFTHRIAEDSITALADLLQRTSFQFPSIRKLREPWSAMFEAVPNRHYQDASARTIPVFDVNAANAVLALLHEVSTELGKITAAYDGAETTELSEPDEEPDEVFGANVMPGIEMDAAEVDASLNESKTKNLGLIAQAQRRVDSMLRGLSSAQGMVDPDPTITNPEDAELRKQRILANTVVYATQDERGRFGINCAPVNVGGIAKQYLSQIKTVILCSATLAVDGGFGHITNVTGVAPTRTEVLPTSFHYDSMGFAYIPRDLPVLGRQHPEYMDVFKRRVDRAVRLVELSDGGAFILTTANDELDMFAEALKHRFPGRTFVQGHRKNSWDGDAPSALAKFRSVNDAILVGSKSFWEGVDVPGGALRLVIMAKLPFPQFNDPIVKARERLAGDAAFREVQMVDMLVDLRQGAGRLIRSKDDRGCVAILDSRVWDKAYGGSVRRALPWSNNLITSDLGACERYLPRFAAHFKRMSTA